MSADFPPDRYRRRFVIERRVPHTVRGGVARVYWTGFYWTSVSALCKRYSDPFEAQAIVKKRFFRLSPAAFVIDSRDLKKAKHLARDVFA